MVQFSKCGSAGLVLLCLGTANLRAGDLPAPAPDPDIQQIVSEISPERIQRSIYVLTSFKTRHTLSDPAPNGDGIGAAAAWIRAEFGRVSQAAKGRLVVTDDTFIQPVQLPRIPKPTSITNIVATLPGNGPDAANHVFIVSGHYDSRAKNPLDAEGAAPGANDNASGAAAVLELARVMSQHEFRSTILFITFAGEEEALNGSTHFAKLAEEKHLGIAGVLNNDIIGSSRSAKGVIDRQTVRVFAAGIPVSAHPPDSTLRLLSTGGENDSPPRELARAIQDTTALYVPSMKIRVIYRMERYLRGSDHVPFVAQGLPAVRLTEPAEDYLHEHEDPRVENGVVYGDTIKFVDFAYVADVTRVNAASLAVLARAPAAPAHVEIETARLENDSTLRWSPNREPDLAGYRVYWRESTSPVWEHSLDVAKDVTRTTIPLSKDDVIFGVAAFDAAGHVSQAVYPTARLTL